MSASIPDGCAGPQAVVSHGVSARARSVTWCADRDMDVSPGAVGTTPWMMERHPGRRQPRRDSAVPWHALHRYYWASGPRKNQAIGVLPA